MTEDRDRRALVDRYIGKQVWGGDEPLWFRADVVADALSRAARAARGKAFVDNVVQMLRDLDDEERMEVFAEFCTYCGTDNPRCQCWNDE